MTLTLSRGVSPLRYSQLSRIRRTGTCLRSAALTGADGISRRSEKTLVLGLETSCDDTGAAVICSESGELVGESLSKQLFSRLGGVVPAIAMGQHARLIPRVVEESLVDVPGSDLREKLTRVAAIAVTNRPGLSGSLLIGTRYAKYLSRRHGVPVIPIHHMEAHALTARMVDDRVDFPFLVLLVSGGHCLLAVAEDIDRFKLLGSSQDNSPGEALDKAARALRLHVVREDLRDLPGGRAIEIVASEGGDHRAVEFPLSRAQHRDCKFSFSGLKTCLFTKIQNLERDSDLQPGQTLDNVSDLAASFQYAVARHLCHRLQRGLIFCRQRELWGEGDRKTLVVSGGVASNQFIKDALKKVCDEFECRLVAPPPKYCTDNGVMIAWNGVEKLRRNRPEDFVPASDVIFGFDISSRAAFGDDLSEEVSDAQIKIRGRDMAIR